MPPGPPRCLPWARFPLFVNLGFQRGDLATSAQKDHAVRRRQRGQTLLGEATSDIGLAREDAAGAPQHDGIEEKSLAASPTSLLSRCC